MTDFLLFENALNEYKKISSENEKIKSDYEEDYEEEYDDEEIIYRNRKYTDSSIEEKDESLKEYKDNKNECHELSENIYFCRLYLLEKVQNPVLSLGH